MAVAAAKPNFPPRTAGAQFAVHDQVEYFSSTMNQWIPAIVVQVNGPHIMLDVKSGQWLGPDEIRTKIRKPPTAASHPMKLKVGDRVLYFAASQGKNFLVEVTAVSPTGDIMISIKPGVWISLEEQRQKISHPEGSTHPGAAVVPAAVVKEVPRCSKGHPLIFTGTNSGNWMCDGAKDEGGCKSGMSKDMESVIESTKIPRFQCKYPGCDYDLCSACAVARSSASTAQNPATCVNGHTLVNVGVTGPGWLCDRVQQGSCASGLTDFNQTASTVRYKCREGCNFDLCDKCFKEGFQSQFSSAMVTLFCPRMHKMDFVGKDRTGWICGASREVNGCANGISTPVTQPGRFACYMCQQGCEYSLCETCAATRFAKSSDTIAPAGPKVSFKFKDPSLEKEEELVKTTSTPSIGSVILDPENHLSELPEQIFHGKHQHPLRLKIEAEANPMNIWKRFVVVGNTCDVCGKKEQMNYYRCKFECKWYCCLECAKDAASYGRAHELTGTSEGAPDSKVKRLEDLNDLQKDFYRNLQKVTNNEFKGEIDGPYSPTRVFAKYDKNADQRIDREEMENVVGFVYKQLGLDVQRQRMVSMIFDSCELDEEGMISMKHFPDVYRRICRRALASFNVMGKQDLMKRAKGDFRHKYDLGKRLAAGVGGVTYLATNKASGKIVVVKRPKKEGNIEDFMLLRDKSHPNIVRVFELFTSQTETFIVMECCSGGDLFGAIEHCFDNFGGLSYNFIAGMIEQAMNGTNYLHMEFLECHNDLKPENILLENKPKSLGDIPRAMVADFGEVSSMDTRGLGDPRYRAPEVWEGPDGVIRGVATADSDVWGLGVMFFELLSGGNLPFIKHRNLANWASFLKFDNHKLFIKLREAMWTPNAQPDYSEIAAAGPYAVDLCKGMMAYDRSKRIKLRKALEHPYFDILKGELKPIDPKLGEVLKRRGNSSSIKIALLNFVASKMQGTSLDRFTEIWQQFDFKHEGVLKQEAFVKMLKEKLDIHEAKAVEIFELADVDNSGGVDFNEFVGVLFDPSFMGNEELESHLKAVFDDMANVDGYLSFKTFVSIFPEDQSVSVLQRIWGEMDGDKDDHVSWEEFRNCFEQM